MTTPSGRRADPTRLRAAQSAGGWFPPAGCGASGRLYTIPSSARVCSGGACLPPAGRAAGARFPRFLRKAWEGRTFRRLLREPSRVRVFAEYFRGLAGFCAGLWDVLAFKSLWGQHLRLIFPLSFVSFIPVWKSCGNPVCGGACGAFRLAFRIVRRAKKLLRVKTEGLPFNSH